MLTAKSEANLAQVHPKLVAVVRRALELVEASETHLGFIVTEGVRTLERQKMLLNSGASRTLNSRHLLKKGYGHAVDIVATLNGELAWDWPLYTKLSLYFKAAAKELDVPLTWGGDWKSFRDGPHYEIPVELPL